MRGDDDLVDELAAAIADGTAIDWAAAESRAATTAGAVMRELRLLESVASLHRGLHQPGAAVSSGPALEPEGAFPRMWAHLRVLEPIGRGAFGVVYRAWDTRLDREVALKLQPDRPWTAGATSAIQEGRALARVRHPNVVTIYGAERIGTDVGLWMEFIRGRTLHQTLAEGGTFEAPAVAAIGVELARALGAVHDAGLVHGDIKAQNVMLAEDGRVVLMDFGAGRDLAQLPQAASAGTPMYLAPEVLRGEPASVSSDIYALGAVLFHLLTGAFPVRATDLHELRRAHDQGDPTDIRSLRPAIGRRLAAVVTRATGRDPGQRHGTAAELEHDLARASSRPMARTAAIAALVAMSLWAAVELGGWTLGRPSPTAALIQRATTPSAPTASDRPVIAVLPFTNLGRGAETDLIVDGFTAEVLHQLAIIDGLHVKSWESSVALRDRPLAELRDRLGVNLVLQGQVLWADRRVRITAQLVDAAGDVPLWSDRFDRDVAEVFAVQDEIARAIVNRLRLKLNTGQRRYDANPKAYELYLKARALTDRRGIEDPAAAVKLFTQVIAIDEAFAPAHAGLANAYGWLSMFPVQTVSLANALVIMRSAATRALELDPRLAEAHAAMGWVLSRERDWRGAEVSFERAIALDPSLASTYTGYTFSTLKPQERYADAERVLQTALDRDPLSLEVAREMAALYYVTDRFDEAIAVLEHVAAQDGQLPLVRRELGRALTFAGRPAEAIPLLEEETPPARHYLTHAYVRVGRRADAERLYAEHRVVANRRAVIAAALGDVDATFEALERMMADEPHRVAQQLIQPEFALLRGDPRRAALRRALGLER